jgi:uncharacterized membrane protein
VYLDWLRGVAVLIMIEAHTFDAWTIASDRTHAAYGWAVIIGGMGAPLFLFLAGVSVVLAATARSTAFGSTHAAARSVRGRGWRIFLYAFLFRLQSFLLSPGAPLVSLLKVDILNIMGPSIVVAAWLWERGRRFSAQLALMVAATIGISMCTPLVRAARWIDVLPDPLGWYLRPAAGHTNFTLLPWTGFVTAGAAAGLWLVHAAGSRDDHRNIGAIAIAGTAIAAASFAASLLPPIYAHTNFWTSSPTFFFLRVGVLLLAVAAAWVWEQWVRLVKWSPIVILGVESLFVYWVHVEIVYGFLTMPLHRRLPLGLMPFAFAAVSGLMLGAAVLKQRVSARWHRRARAQPHETLRTS